MYEYQAVRVRNLGLVGFGSWDESGAIPGAVGVNVDQRLTQLMNYYVQSGWEVDHTSIGGTQGNLFVLVIFRRLLK
ncbi:MAG: hypothetical protein FWG15_03400 [Propionibacteriaceae bacterium]|nr:hypothetical protein [Propionibacteriaceae bacterium]